MPNDLPNQEPINSSNDKPDDGPGGVTRAIEEYRQGKKGAFEVLVREYERPLREWLKRKLKSARPGMRNDEDLSQSVFFELARSLDDDQTWIRNMANSDEVRGVLFRIATCRLLNAIRYERQECRRGALQDQDLQLPSNEPFSSSLVDHSSLPESEAVAELTRDEMEQKLAEFKPRLVPVFHRLLAGENNCEIARVLDKSEGAVRRDAILIRKILSEWEKNEMRQLEEREDDQ